MSFVISDEQQAFASAVSELLHRFDQRLDPRDGDDTQREALWLEIADQLSLPAIVLPEDLGGAGGTFTDVAIALETLAARPAVGGLPGMLAGMAALLTSSSPRALQVAAEVASGKYIVIPTWLFSDRAWAPTDEDAVVPAGRLPRRMFIGSDDVDVLLAAPTRTSVRALIPVKTTNGLELWLSTLLTSDPHEPLASVDPGTVVLKLSNESMTAEPLHRGDPRASDPRASDPGTDSASAVSVDQLIDHAVATANALCAIEAVGSSTALLDRTVDYLKIREQFGQVLASMQGLQFMAADLYRKIEPLRSLAYAAVEALDNGDRAEIIELSTAAKIAADELHCAASLEAIQMHGGIGFSWELGLHRHYKHALMNRTVGGDDGARRQLLSQRIRDRATVLHRYSGSTESDAELRQEVRTWIARHREHAPRKLAAIEPMMYEHTEHEARWVDRLREGRWLCLSWPEEYGGRGLTALQCIAVNEEFAAAGVPRLTLGLGESLIGPALLAHGTHEQKRRLLPRILSGEDVYCQGFSEPGHGSDLARLQTRGEVSDSGISVTGTKIWQSAAHVANKILLLCRTDRDARPHAGLTYCIADMHDNGITVEPIRMMPGFYGYNQTNLDGAHVAPENIIGGVNNGWKVAMTTLSSERAGEITTQYLGFLGELDHLIAELDAAGRLEPQQLDLVPLWIEVLKMKVNGLRVVEEMRSGGSCDGLMAIDKVNWSEHHVHFGLEAARLLGLRGLVRAGDPDGRPGIGEDVDLPHLQRVLLESPGRRISRGTNQIQRRIIAQRTLGMPR